MWQIWTSGILGLWVILLAFLDFSSTLTMFFLDATGAVLAALNFWLLSLVKTPERQHPDSEILPPEHSESEHEAPTLDEIEVGVPTLKDVGEGDEAGREPKDNTPKNN